MKTIPLAASLLLSLALPAHALVDSMSMARAFPEGGLEGADASDVQVSQARELVAKALGDDVRDLVFIPITPCTVWDTRFATNPASAGIITNGTTKKFYSHLDGAGGSFATWGGNPTCPEASQNFIGGRPFAVMITVYISDATANGWLTLYRDGDADPSQATISVYYSPGPTRTQTVISKSSRGYGVGAYDVAATSRFGSTHASASVTGYFIKATNITLPNSTAATGNILKGATRFLHNFGNNNAFLGVSAGNFTLTGGSNAGVGVQALSASTTGGGNVAHGYRALAGTTTGGFNTAIGFQALQSNTVGDVNTAVGSNALAGNTTGFQNTAVGEGAMFNNTTGSYNTVVGWNAGLGGSSANLVTAIGYRAQAASSAGGDTAIGTYALETASGGNNIGLGYGAGAGLNSGASNIMIGHYGVSGESTTTRIGTPATMTRAFIAGIRGRTTAVADAVNVIIDSAGQLGTLNSSRRVKDDITDMDQASARLMNLRPVMFHYKAHKAAGDLQPQYGLVAEEVVEQMPELVARSADGGAETVYYQFLPPLLLNEYQKQQRTIERLEARVSQLAELVHALSLAKKGSEK